MKKIICNTQIVQFYMLIIVLVLSCNKKEENNIPELAGYTSMSDFYTANGVKTETFTINAATGGSFVSAKGTKVIVPANVFLNPDSTQTTGNVKIEFKDIYSKSDMLLSNMHTMMEDGSPLVSGGEFFIKATQANNSSIALSLNGTSPIKVEQPLNGKPADSAMEGFVLGNWSGGVRGWQPTTDSVTISNYNVTLNKFAIPSSDGTWFNTDKRNFFQGYPQTVLAVNPNVKPSDYDLKTFFVFKGVNSVVNIISEKDLDYKFAPVGLQCTVVTVGVKGGKLYSSFTNITITTMPIHTVNVSVAETTETDFKTKLAALNN